MESVDLFSELSKAEKLKGKLRGQVAAIIINRRGVLGVTQKVFAKILGVPYRTIKKIENCEYEFTIDELIDLLEVFNIEYNFEIGGFLD